MALWQETWNRPGGQYLTFLQGRLMCVTMILLCAVICNMVSGAVMPADTKANSKRVHAQLDPVKDANSAPPPCTGSTCRSTSVLRQEPVYRPCDRDLCAVTQMFCWKSMDGEGDRTCRTCQDLRNVCSLNNTWDSLTDCLTYYCLVPEMQEKDTRIHVLEEQLTSERIIMSTVIGVLFFLFVVHAVYVHRPRRCRKTKDAKEDCKSLLILGDSNLNGNGDTGKPDGQGPESVDLGQHVASAPPWAPPNTPLSHESEAHYCERLKHIPPTETGESYSGELVTSISRDRSSSLNDQ